MFIINIFKLIIIIFAVNVYYILHNFFLKPVILFLYILFTYLLFYYN